MLRRYSTLIGGRLVAKPLMTLIILAMLAAGCAGDDGDVAEDTDVGEEAEAIDDAPEGTATEDDAPEEAAVEDLGRLTIATSTSPIPDLVNAWVGPIDYGEEFGLSIERDDVIEFDAHSTATQTVLSGQADVVQGSFVSHLVLRETGQDFQVFCPGFNGGDFVFVGSNGVDSLEDLLDPETSVALDSLGGSGHLVANALLRPVDAVQEDLPNTTILTSSGQRTTAFANGDVDATVIHLYQLRQAEDQVEDPVILATLYEDAPVYITNSFAATAEWLEENSEAAAAMCASVFLANRELIADFDAYSEAVSTYIEEPPDQQVLEVLFELLPQFWPTEGGLDQDAVTFMAELGVDAGLLESLPEDLEDAIAYDILERAAELVDEHSS